MHRHRLQLKADAGHLSDKPLHNFIVERVPFRLLPVPVGVAFGPLCVQARLLVQRADHRVRIEEQLQKRIEQSSYEAERAAMGVVNRRVLERERQFGGRV